MKRCTICLLVLCLSLLVSSAAAQSLEMEKAALAAAEQWLSLVDSGDYGQSWMEAAGYFRNAITKEKWVQSLKAIRDPLGKLISRDVKSTIYMTSLHGTPDGEYVVIHFAASFEKKKTAIETVTPTMEQDGSWRVSGYYIK